MITVVGSVNMDLAVTVPHMPVSGETVIGGNMVISPGGKGANQAVAAARLGGKVDFVGLTGKDNFGLQCAQNFEKQNVNIKYLLTSDDVASGIALITVDENGNNAITVSPGANAKLTPAHIDQAQELIASSKILVVQLEVPLETVERAIDIGRQHHALIILNPAPARLLNDEILQKVDILTPNENEAAFLTGIEVTDADSAQKAARVLLDKGVGAVIITLGAKGFLLAADGTMQMIASRKVNAVDTTAAGDTFTGALAYALAQGQDIIRAAQFANVAAALSTIKIGAQTAMPTLSDIKCFVQDGGLK